MLNYSSDRAHPSSSTLAEYCRNILQFIFYHTAIIDSVNQSHHIFIHPLWSKTSYLLDASLFRNRLILHPVIHYHLQLFLTLPLPSSSPICTPHLLQLVGTRPFFHYCVAISPYPLSTRLGYLFHSRYHS